MKRITTFVENNKKDLKLDITVSHSRPKIMKMNNAGIFWKFKNITNGDNDEFSLGTQKITFGEGYWTFDMIKEKLKTYFVTFVANEHDNTCTISPTTADLDMKNFGPVSGFLKNHAVKINMTATHKY